MGRLQRGASLAQARAAASLVMARLMKDYGLQHPLGARRGVLRESMCRPSPFVANFTPLVVSALTHGAAGAGDYGGECGQSALSRAPPTANGRWRFAALWAPRARVCCASCSPRARCSPWPPELSARSLPSPSFHARQDDRSRRHGAPGQHRHGLAIVCLHLPCFAGRRHSAGLLPALKATRLEVLPLLKNSPGNAGNRHRLRSLLVIGQVAISCVVLICAGLAARSVQKLSQINLGFRPDHIFLASVDPALQRYSDEPAGDFKRSCSTSSAPCPASPAPASPRICPSILEAVCAPASGRRVKPRPRARSI